MLGIGKRFDLFFIFLFHFKYFLVGCSVLLGVERHTVIVALELSVLLLELLKLGPHGVHLFRLGLDRLLV